MERDDSEEGYGGAIGSGLLEGAKHMVKGAGETILKDARPLTRFKLMRIPGVPGLVYDAADFATAKNKVRAGIGIAGGLAGGFVGEAGGPVGAAMGSAAGEAGAEWLYDHRTDIGDWMKRRVAQAAHGFDRGMPPFSSTLR
jgi:hypothetical protein